MYSGEILGRRCQGFVSTSVCKLAAAVEAAFAQGADTLLAKMAGLTACLHNRKNGVVLCSEILRGTANNCLFA